MSRGVSLANKCQLLFGGAVVVIVTAALIGPWIRLGTIVDDAQLENSRQIADLWASDQLLAPEIARLFGPETRSPGPASVGLTIRSWTADEWERERFSSGFLEAAQRRLAKGPREPGDLVEHAETIWDQGDRAYRYARLLADGSGVPTGVVVVDRRSSAAASLLMVNRMFLLVAGIGAGVIAVLVFYFITTRIILSPVRALKRTADTVRAGNLQVRSELRTGDEFEQLSEAFNSMLADLTEQQQLLRGINRSLDLRLNELAERNSALFEAARVKGEFLANISHELRTPLNSIIGFAEILQDIAAQDEANATEPPSPVQLAKRRRYLHNIVNAGRSLLEMINELLMMAKIEAGRIELNLQPVNVAETCEALAALIHPLSERKRLTISLQLQSAAPGGFTSEPARCDLPLVETDQQKFHHVVFNFLSNAVKFTPEGGRVTLRAERLVGGDGLSRVRVSVLDTGPGIAADKRQVIFEKFSQLDSGHTKEHQGAGLGLAIAKEFAELLQGEIQVESEIGRGSMFSLIIPLSVDRALLESAKARMVERAAMAGRRVGDGESRARLLNGRPS